MSKSTAYGFLSKDIQEQILAALTLLSSMNIGIAPDATKIANNSFLTEVKKHVLFFVWWEGAGEKLDQPIVGEPALHHILKECKTCEEKCITMKDEHLCFFPLLWKPDFLRKHCLCKTLYLQQTAAVPGLVFRTGVFQICVFVWYMENYLFLLWCKGLRFLVVCEIFMDAHAECNVEQVGFTTFVFFCKGVRFHMSII